MSLIETWLFAPFVHEFMQRGLVVAVLVGTVCAVLSCFLVLKGWSLMGDAVSHAVLPGIVLAHIVWAARSASAISRRTVE
jgi:manganese/iron transport system permease protein